MADVLKLRGGAALSTFRLEKIEAALAAQGHAARLYAEFWHFAEASAPLAPSESETLARILSYGEPAVPARAVGNPLLVLPRAGTVSPWSSKASDIAEHCGLKSV